MPEETIRAFQDHGKPSLTLEQGLDDARQLLSDLAAAGIDYDDVTDALEKEGVEKFEASFAELIQGIVARREGLLAA
jgi:transaldolase